MSKLQGLATVAGRVMLGAIFFLSAVGNKIPHFGDVASYMASVGVPFPRVLLAGAIVFLVAGSVSVVVGYKARLGAGLLLAFLILATYYFHDFWNFEGQAREQQMIQFMKNLSLMGTMLFLAANGPGPLSIDARSRKSCSQCTSDEDGPEHAVAA